MENRITKLALFAKSFYLLGDSLNYCYDCSYCRLNGEKCEQKHYSIIPTKLNSNFDKVPVAVNLFYGDPLLQVDNTIRYLRELEKAHHKGPVLIVTKGDFSKFPDIPFDLDLHFAFSTFGVDSKYDGSTMKRFKNNLEHTRKRKHNYRYSIEFRPICYNINDSFESFDNVLSLAKEYNMAIGYSGLQGKPSSVQIWKENGIDLNPYPGYEFGHKKIIDDKVVELLEKMAKQYNVPIFRKTSCLISYVHGYERDYNAHYYRPNELGCNQCVMHDKCMKYKEHMTDQVDLSDIIPFDHEIVKKEHHECVLKKFNICEFPTADCSNISGYIIRIDEKLTASDIRLIKWLTGYTVDATFEESPYINKKWIDKKELKLENS